MKTASDTHDAKHDAAADTVHPLLSDAHLRMLRDESAITDAIIAARGYRTATKKSALKDLGFSDTQCRVPALVLPVYSVAGTIAFHQIRPDEPRAGHDGKPIKYETPSKTRMAVDAHPSMRQHLGNPQRPLFITEGIRKADAAVSKGLCCIAVLGVWNWRGTNDDGGKVALPDWESIALNEREIYLVFDSDVMLKSSVYHALGRLKAFLESRRAWVRLIYLEPRTDGGKVGLDDFFAAGASPATLLALATDKLRPAPQDDAAASRVYQETPHGLVWRKPTRDGAMNTPLTNFTARIVGDVVHDDGAETQRFFDIEARLGERRARKLVAAERFPSLGWIVELLGARAILAPGQTIRDHARAAIQILSPEIAERHVYAHLGWRQVNDAWFFLHAGGAIGADGPVPAIEVSVAETLSRFTLSAPPVGEEQRAAVCASLRLLTVAPSRVTVPLFAGVWRAVLGATDFSLHVAGPTGAGKSELAALVQQHYGPAMDARHLPGAWSSTSNALEGLAFAAKDCLFTVDDFAPTGSNTDVQRLHREADRIFRAQGNAAGRQRMRADTTLRPPKPPRALILSTGEDIPRGQSLRARLFTVEVSPDDVNWTVLSRCQRDATDGLYAAALAGFVRWLAPQYDNIRSHLKRELEGLRTVATRGTEHKRTPEGMANLALGFRYFLRFACETTALTRDQADTHWRDAWDALYEAARRQSAHHAASDPTQRFLELLAAALASGRAHVAKTDGHAPDEATAWGWRTDPGQVERRPYGERIGWLDGENLYVAPDAAFAVVQKLAHDQGESLPITSMTLYHRLKERHLLASSEPTRHTPLVRKTVEGKRLAVLHFHAEMFHEGDPSPPSMTDQNDHHRQESGSGHWYPPLWSGGTEQMTTEMTREKTENSGALGALVIPVTIHTEENRSDDHTSEAGAKPWSFSRSLDADTVTDAMTREVDPAEADRDHPERAHSATDTHVRQLYTEEL